ncbi:phosphotransferase family protein [Nonomuraea sp. NPDC050328]|uniref:phosphotransferase family protein n=1 Tax=Nonomuraea sp. NPDC050328 TaxID=3364361 RepID=UPI0037AE6A84
MARVTPVSHPPTPYELDLALELARAGSPAAAPDPRVTPQTYEHDDFLITLWTYHPPTQPPAPSPPAYARALKHLHTGMRQITLPTPHFLDRVASAQDLLSNPAHTPALPTADRTLLRHTLRTLSDLIVSRGAPEQLLHGEPHPGNLLSTSGGLLFIDFETYCRGPVEFDLAHAPEQVASHYPDIDPVLLQYCRLLVLAMITTWRWDRDDHLPNGTHLRTTWLTQLRQELTHANLPL